MLLTERDKGETNWFPPCDLFIVPDSRYVGVPAGPRIDECRFGDGQGARDACALSVVLYGERTGDVLCVCAASCHRRQHDAVLQLRSADVDWLKELRNEGGHIVFKSETKRSASLAASSTGKDGCVVTLTRQPAGGSSHDAFLSAETVHPIERCHDIMDSTYQRSSANRQPGPPLMKASLGPGR